MDKVSESSLKISELQTLTALPDDAYFVIESTTASASYKVAFKDIKDTAMQMLSASLSIGTIASANAEDYSYASHCHDYTDFWFYPSYGPQSSNSRYHNVASCDLYGYFDIVKYLPGIDAQQISSISAYAPKSIDANDDETLRYHQYSIGDLQLIAVTNQTFQDYLTGYRGYSLKHRYGYWNIDYRLSSFDGWVIPNGALISCKASEFQDACQMYAGNKNATQFNLPCLSTFFKPLTNASSTDALKWHNYYNAVPEHTHYLSSDFSSKKITVNAGNFSIPASDSQHNLQKLNTFLHGGQSKSDNYVKIPLSKMHIETSKLAVADLSKEGENTESWPRHSIVLPLLYIGKR